MQSKKKRTALAGLLIAAAAVASAQGRVSGVSVSKLPHGVEVLIQGSELKDPKGIFETGNRLYTLEFDVPYAGKAEKTQVWMNGLETVTTASKSMRSPKTKFTFKFTKAVTASVSKTDNGYKIDFESTDSKTSETPKTVDAPISAPVEPVNTAAQGFTNTHFLGSPSDTAVTTKSGSTQKSFMESTTEWLKSLPAAKPDTSVKTAAKASTPAKQDTAVVKPAVKAPETNTQAQTFATNLEKKPTTENKVYGPTNTKKDGEAKVSIDFSNTEIVQILKSLARQSNANIVTSPDVTGKLSIKLDNVSLRESLNFVTSLAGLRFSQIGNTYVVTSQAKFLETIRSVQGSQEDMTLSRIVPIYSGQGTSIKVAVLKSVSSENAYGRFELILPSEKSVVSANQKVTAPGEKKDDEKGGTNIATETTESGKDAYVMVIGSPGRLDEVEHLVTGIDRQLCSALGMKVPNSTAQVIDTYFVHGGRASDLIDALAGKGKTSIGSVELYATPTNSISKQSIVVKGREDEVQNVIKALSQLDSDETTEASVFKIVDLMYADPRSLRELVVAQVPGVTCVIAPSGVMNPTTYVQDGLRNQSEQRGTGQPAPQGGGTAAASGQNTAQQAQGGQATGGTSSGEMKQSKESADNGITLPFQDFEKVAVPMRLIVKGTREQVDRAMQWVKELDVAPKQVALEMRVMELSREELLQLGINWNLFTSGAIKTITLNNAQPSPSNKIGVTVQGHDMSGDVAASLDSISNGTNLISRPNLICNDGRESEVFVGDAIRYVESIITGQNGPSVTTGTVRAGVRLACFPRIGGDETLNLDIRTAITYLKGFTTIPQLGGQLPQTSERTAQNTITMKDGETFAIGGLIQQQDVVELSGLPILKDLPFFGQFFRRTKKDKIKTELVIFVTARVVGPGKSKDMPLSKDSNIMKNKTGLPGGRG